MLALEIIVSVNIMYYIEGPVCNIYGTLLAEYGMEYNLHKCVFISA